MKSKSDYTAPNLQGKSNIRLCQVNNNQLFIEQQGWQSSPNKGNSPLRLKTNKQTNNRHLSI